MLRIDGRIAERPQHMIMRVAVGIHGRDVEKVIETYNLMSERYFTHASPTLFNAGTPHPQLSSCFLVAMKDDSIEGIYDTLKTCAMISKTAGGIGLNIHNIRAKGSYIAGTNGYSNGIVPMLRAYDATARYVDQGGNKRPGAFAYVSLFLLVYPQSDTLSTASTSNLGTRMSSISSTCERTTARKKSELETCSTRSGFRTCLCDV